MSYLVRRGQTEPAGHVSDRFSRSRGPVLADLFVNCSLDVLAACGAGSVADARADGIAVHASVEVVSSGDCRRGALEVVPAGGDTAGLLVAGGGPRAGYGDAVMSRRLFYLAIGAALMALAFGCAADPVPGSHGHWRHGADLPGWLHVSAGSDRLRKRLCVSDEQSCPLRRLLQFVPFGHQLCQWRLRLPGWAHELRGRVRGRHVRSEQLRRLRLRV